MTKATTKALELGLLHNDNLSEVYAQGDNRIMWHDNYFSHLLEVVDSDEVIYQSRPFPTAESWEFEDI